VLLAFGRLGTTGPVTCLGQLPKPTWQTWSPIQRLAQVGKLEI
jgi:hypothetical protein